MFVGREIREGRELGVDAYVDECGCEGHFRETSLYIYFYADVDCLVGVFKKNIRFE